MFLPREARKTRPHPRTPRFSYRGKRPAPPPENLSSTSGAAKRRAKKADQAAVAVGPPSLLELIHLVLPTFEKGRIFYRSMLRVKVQSIDPVKSLKRKFGD